MSEIPNDPGLKAIESALGGLSPVPSRLDRDALMYRAGAISRGRTERTRWVWPSVAAFLAIALTGESILLATRPGATVVDRIVIVREPSVRPDSGHTGPSPVSVVILNQNEPRSDSPDPSSRETVSDHQRQQDLFLRFGLDAFPEPVRLISHSGGSSERSEEGSMSAGVLRRIELEKLNKPGDHS